MLPEQPAWHGAAPGCCFVCCFFQNDLKPCRAGPSWHNSTSGQGRPRPSRALLRLGGTWCPHQCVRQQGAGLELVSLD